MFFRELNKHEMYMSTVRLYQKHGLDKITDDSDNKMAQMLKSQYEYARDHLL